MDNKVYEQICNVASLQGIVGAAYAMPDAHWGYGFPIGGVAAWAIKNGYGESVDLEYIEEHGSMEGADPTAISNKAKERQKLEMGTLGSGNHYLEVQEIKEIFHPKAAEVLGLNLRDVVISIHCGSRGLGHQIGTDYLRTMLEASKKYQIEIPDRELACAPINSKIGQEYLGAMRGAINCALANRQIITHFTRHAFKKIFPHSQLRLVYDVSYNTCKNELHTVNGEKKDLYVHRKGATRSFGPHHPNIPLKYKEIGQPVLIGGSMGVGSYVLVGTSESEALSFSSACHGAGRAMSRTEATKHWTGPKVIQDLKEQGILIRSGSYRGVAEEAPDAYKNLHEVVGSAQSAKLALKVAYLTPHICIKG
jgi:tRNA-splicing ligase RtcB